MTIENLPLVNILVWIMAGLVLVQTAMLVVTNVIVRQKVRDIDRGLQSFSQQSVKGMQMISQAIDGVEEVLPRLPEAQKTIERNLDALVETTQTVSRAVGRGVDLARYQVAEADNGADALLSTLSQRIFKAHQSMSHPSLRLATIIRSGMGILKQTWLKEDRSPASHPPEDEENFV
jgi:hypothetical protein